MRYQRGRNSPEGYYRDARDLAAFRSSLLDPLGPGGEHRYATASLDLATDTSLEPDWRVAEPDAILVCDGTFLQRPELQECWDAVVYLDGSADFSLASGLARDGGDMEAVYRSRYIPAEDIYLSEVDPRASADWVVDARSLRGP